MKEKIKGGLWRSQGYTAYKNNGSSVVISCYTLKHVSKLKNVVIFLDNNLHSAVSTFEWVLKVSKFLRKHG